MNTRERRRRYVLQRLRERSRFPKSRHHRRRGVYHPTHVLPVAQDWKNAAVDCQWDRLEQAGLVRLSWQPDTHVSYDDLVGDCFSPARYAETPGGRRTVEAEERALRDKIDQDGVWGLVGEYRLQPCDQCSPWNSESCAHPDWRQGDSVWGLVGFDSCGYELDIKQATIDALRTDLRHRLYAE